MYYSVMDVQKCLSANLKRIRKSKRLSQKILADSVGISYNHMSDIERGAKWPRPETIKAIARVLKIKPTELLLDDSLVLERVKKALSK